MEECIKCGSKRFEATEAPERVTVGGRVFTGSVAAKRCRKCGELYLDGRALEAFQLLAAAKLADAGEATGEAFKFMRKAAGLRGADLAALLDVAGETVSRWETGALPVERRAVALLGSIVSEAASGSTATIDRLRALAKPSRLPKRVKLGRDAA